MRTILVALLSVSTIALAADSDGRIPSGSKIYVQPMEGFGSYVVAAINKKRVAVSIVANREQADFEIGGNSESQKAGWAKVLVTRSTSSTEEASINVTNLRTGEVIFAYNVNKQNAIRGKQSAAEACAKHLKEVITDGPVVGAVRSGTADPARDTGNAALSQNTPAVALAVASTSQPTGNVQHNVVIRFTSTPGPAEVQIDGEYWGSTPTAAVTRLAAGPHTILVKKLGYQPWERKITLVPGDDRTVNAELEPERSDNSKPRVAGLN